MAQVMFSWLLQVIDTDKSLTPLYRERISAVLKNRRQGHCHVMVIKVSMEGNVTFIFFLNCSLG